MATYLDMRTRIADELNRTDLTAQISKAVLSAIAKHERQRFYFNQKTATFATVADQEYYAAAAHADIPTLVTIMAATVTNSGVKSPLRVVPFDAIDDEQDGSIKGAPTVLAYFAQQVRLYPIPDAAYTVTMAYHYRLTTLSADADTNAWTNDAEELIRRAAKRIIHTDIERDLEAATVAAQAEAEALDTLDPGDGPAPVKPTAPR